MKGNKRKGYQRPDHTGLEQGIFKHNKAILKKTATVCALCGMPIDKSLKYPDPMSFTVDHIIPAKLGGNSNIDNLQPAHWICNRQKGAKLLTVNAKDIKPAERDTTLPQYIDWSSYDDDLK